MNIVGKIFFKFFIIVADKGNIPVSVLMYIFGEFQNKSIKCQRNRGDKTYLFQVKSPTLKLFNLFCRGAHVGAGFLNVFYNN